MTITNQRLIEDMLQVRLIEMESREQILKSIADVHEKRVWRDEGYRTLQAFCMDRLGYERNEARDLAIAVGAILTADSLRAETPEAQVRVESLREWRRHEAKAQGVAAYRVFSNRLLLEVACRNPKSVEDLQKIKGFGLKKTEAFGGALIRHLTDLNH